MKMQCRTILVILSIVSALSALTRADVLTISGATNPEKIADTSIFGGFVNNSGGGTLGIFSGRDSMNRTSRSLIEFDISAIPAGATITGVQLTMTLGLVGGSGGGGADTTARDIGMHLASASWGEGNAGSSATTFTGTGNGFAASTGDATWNARFFDASTPTLWSTPGGDFSSTASAITSIGTRLTPCTWSSAAMAFDVQGWVNNPSTNFGWLMKHEVETSVTGFPTNRAFWSSEAPTASNRPQLQITYTVPEPAIALPALLLLCMQRRMIRRTR
jgi:hypothetical protein